MKRGMIVYLAGEWNIGGEIDWSEQRRYWKVDTVRLAASEFEIAYHWWRMIQRGIQHISCLPAMAREEGEGVSFFGPPLRLWG